MRATFTALTLAIAAAGCSQQPVHRTWAEIVSAGPAGGGGRWNTDQVYVTYRGTNGVLGQKMVHLSQLTCHVGYTVPASEQGVALTIDEAACVRHGP